MADEPLTPNEQAALDELMFELSAPHTLDEIARHLGVSRFAVARIERKALRKLREATADRDAVLRDGPVLHRAVNSPIATVGLKAKQLDPEE